MRGVKIFGFALLATFCIGFSVLYQKVRFLVFVAVSALFRFRFSAKIKSSFRISYIFDAVCVFPVSGRPQPRARLL